MQGSIIYDPLLPWVVIGVAGVAMLVVLGFAQWRGLRGWGLRTLAAMLLFIALSNPSFQREERESLSDIVLLIVDQTTSQQLSDRPEQIDTAVATLRARIAARANTELRVVRLDNAPDNGGTLLMSRLGEAIAQVPHDRIAGAILLSDGQLHDLNLAPDMAVPLHLLMSGRASDWDRRLVIANAPAFAILGESVTLTLRIEDQGRVPPQTPQLAALEVSVDGAAPQVVMVPVGRDIEFPINVEHGGINVIQFKVPGAPDELTARNNSAVVQINGVRDRLRVLLVSGEPHPGERTWRNLLKSDSSVDLVHFTILRPPEKQDGVPVDELSLIAFPTRELFLEKIDEFDLIIFDRYKLRGILPSVYLDSVRRYVENGGAVLVAAGPGFATVDSLYRSPLGAILPAAPTSHIIEGGFHPQISELGERHPVTAGLDTLAAPGDDGAPWGRWLRLIEVKAHAGHTVMTDPNGQPLLVLERVEKGRIALLTSDHVWLWSRGFEGGGPQLELLRRLAHWMMKEPELEEEALQVFAQGQEMTITRRTLGSGARDVEIIAPDGTVTIVPMVEQAPGRYIADFSAPDLGLYRLREGEQDIVVGLGPSAPKEFEETIATSDKLRDVVKATRGGIMTLEEGVPDLRNVTAGRVAAGRGWIGLVAREAYLTIDVRLTSLVPGWLLLALSMALSIAAWLREGQR